MLFWNIGKTIIANTKYGSKFIDNLARDIHEDFPNLKGYSVRNLKYMRKFAEFFPYLQKVQSLLALLSWTHNLRIMDAVTTADQYEWYAEQTISNGWSVRTLEYHLETQGYERQALPQNKASNYKSVLPSLQSDLAIETLKSTYVFDFIEKRIINQLRIKN
jgi:predicted nuclease of restriction endonuclease-like (RecB) superfamily